MVVTYTMEDTQADPRGASRPQEPPRVEDKVKYLVRWWPYMTSCQTGHPKIYLHHHVHAQMFEHGAGAKDQIQAGFSSSRRSLQQ